MQQPAARKAIAAAAPKSASVEGTLKLLHADNFEGGASQFVWTVEQDDGQGSELDIPIAPTDMKAGMRVLVTGTRSGTMITPDSIAALTQAPADGVAAAPVTSSVLVILLNFQPTPPAVAPSQPFTQAAVDAVVFSGTGSIAAYWSEVSFGNQLMTGTVTPWLTASFQAPTTCDYYGIATEARRVAQLAGFNPANYQKVHYLFTRVSACGWAGLGEVPGSQTWSNQYNTLGVIGHELGHNFGLGHANSLPCNGVTIATNCPLARPEYGDPWDIMGNVSARSVNAWQKNSRGWVPDAKVATHTVGTASYTLSPLTSPGGTLYAVQVPAAAAQNVLDRIPASHGLRRRTAGLRDERGDHSSRRTHAPGGSQRVWMLGHVLSRHGARDIDDVRRRAAGAQRVRRCADRSHDLGGIEGRRWLDGDGREPADAH